jgi:lactoylglutathione lyase
MIPVRGLFETHLTVSDLERSIAFYGGVLGLELAHRDADRKAAFYWMGGRGEAMLGLWQVGASPQRMNLHIAFKVDLPDLLDATRRLQAASIAPLDFWGNPSGEVTVLAWMPALPCTFTTLTETFWSILRCFLSLPGPSWELLAGAAGRTAREFEPHTGKLFARRPGRVEEVRFLA